MRLWDGEYKLRAFLQKNSSLNRTLDCPGIPHTPALNYPKTVIFVTFTFPVPITQGNRRSICSMISWLRHEGYRVVYVLQAVHITPDLRGQLEELVDELIVIGDIIQKKTGKTHLEPRNPRSSWPETIEEIERLGEACNPLAIIGVYMYMAPCFENLPKRILTLIHTIDVHSRVAGEIGALGVDTQARECSVEEERNLLLKCDVIIAIQKNEAKIFREMVPEREVITVSYSADRIVSEPVGDAVANRVLMVASNNPLNCRGLELFCAEAWPLVLAAFPSAQLRVVGGVSSALPESSPNAEAAGVVEYVEAEYEKAAIVINPVDLGTGLKIKSVEALCLGKALVSTPAGVEGLEQSELPPFLVADDWTKFAECVILLLTNHELRKEIAKRAVSFARANFSEDKAYAELNSVLKRHESQFHHVFNASHKMRIAIFGQNSPTHYSGGRYHSWGIAEALAYCGHEVYYITDHKPVFYDDFSLHPGHKDIHLCITGDFLFHNIPDGDFDVVFIIPGMHHNPSLYLKAIYFKEMRGAHLAFLNFETPNWYNSLSPSKRNPALWDNWKSTAAYASLILSISREGDKFAHLFYDTVQPEARFYYYYPLINDIIADTVTGIKKEKRIILMTRFEWAEHKGGMQSSSLICEAMRGYTLVLIVGTGKVPQNVMNVFFEKAKEHGVTLDVKYRLTDREKFKEIKHATLMLFPSFFEGFGLPPVEAQYCNVPCIAFDLPVLREVSGDGIIYVESGNWEQFRAKIGDVLNSGESYEGLRENIKKVARLDQYAQTLDHILRLIAEKKPRKSLMRRSYVTIKLYSQLFFDVFPDYKSKLAANYRSFREVSKRFLRTILELLVSVVTLARSIFFYPLHLVWDACRLYFKNLAWRAGHIKEVSMRLAGTGRDFFRDLWKLLKTVFYPLKGLWQSVLLGIIRPPVRALLKLLFPKMKGENIKEETFEYLRKFVCRRK